MFKERRIDRFMKRLNNEKESLVPLKKAKMSIRICQIISVLSLKCRSYYAYYSYSIKNNITHRHDLAVCFQTFAFSLADRIQKHYRMLAIFRVMVSNFVTHAFSRDKITETKVR